MSHRPSDGMEAEETSRCIARAVAGPPERQRLALVLLRYEGRSYRRVAAVVEISESATESLISRALAVLRRQLSDPAEMPR